MMKAGLLAAALLFTALGGAHGSSCGDKDGNGNPVTDAECVAQATADGKTDAAYWFYETDRAALDCYTSDCSGAVDLTLYGGCCDVPTPTCGDKDGVGGGPVTDAECVSQANTEGDSNAALWFYQTGNAATGCDLPSCAGSDLTGYGGCCDEPYYRCGDKDGVGGGPVTDAECEAYQTGYVYDSNQAYSSCSNNPCSGDDLTGYGGCCDDGTDDYYNNDNYWNDDNFNTIGTGECDYIATWYTMVALFSFVGAAIAIVGIVFGCLPTCCGMMTDKKTLTGWLAIVVGIVALLIPAIVSGVMVESAISKYCDECAYANCDEDEEDDLKAELHTLGFFVAYTYAFGFLPAGLGVTSICMGTAALCGCCKAKPGAAGAAGAAGASGVVVMATPAAPAEK